MENLAYLHVADVFEDTAIRELTLFKTTLGWLKSLGQGRSSNRLLLLLLGAACTTFVFNLASAAQALQFGDSGSDVTYLQTLLTDNGYPVPATGQFLELTENQVFNFQADNGLAADGIAGEATLAVLESGGLIPIRPDGEDSGLLQFGSEGGAVLDLQSSLNAAGYFFGPYTGYFGDSTESAVIAFQLDSGLVADGVAGPATLAALDGGLVGIRPDVPSVGGGLQFGSSGPDVEYVQQLLNFQGYGVPVTGFFGDATDRQVRSIQFDNGLDTDGIVGPATLAVLESGGGFQAVRPGDEIEGGFTFQFGDVSDAVASLQQLLADRGYYNGPIDGIYGSATSNAVFAYQIDLGIPADGLWGPQTAGASV